jgi:hypothetical protein
MDVLWYLTQGNFAAAEKLRKNTNQSCSTTFQSEVISRPCSSNTTPPTPAETSHEEMQPEAQTQEEALKEWAAAPPADLTPYCTRISI